MMQAPGMPKLQGDLSLYIGSDTLTLVMIETGNYRLWWALNIIWSLLAFTRE